MFWTPFKFYDIKRSRKVSHWSHSDSRSESRSDSRSESTCIEYNFSNSNKFLRRVLMNSWQPTNLLRHFIFLRPSILSWESPLNANSSFQKPLLWLDKNFMLPVKIYRGEAHDKVLLKSLATKFYYRWFILLQTFRREINQGGFNVWNMRGVHWFFASHLFELPTELFQENGRGSHSLIIHFDFVEIW